MPLLAIAASPAPPARLDSSNVIIPPRSVVRMAGTLFVLSRRRMVRVCHLLRMPATRWFRLFCTYYKWSFDSYKNLFNINNSNALLIAAARVHPIPLIYLNVMFRKSIGPDVARVGLATDAWDLKADLDISWEF